MMGVHTVNRMQPFVVTGASLYSAGGLKSTNSSKWFSASNVRDFLYWTKKTLSNPNSDSLECGKDKTYVIGNFNRGQEYKE